MPPALVGIKLFSFSFSQEAPSAAKQKKNLPPTQAFNIKLYIGSVRLGENKIGNYELQQHHCLLMGVCEATMAFKGTVSFLPQKL